MAPTPISLRDFQRSNAVGELFRREDFVDCAPGVGVVPALLEADLGVVVPAS
jgi:hypothetical protein